VLEDIFLRCDQEGSQATTTFHLTPIVVVVGPNGSGKSLLLRELETFFIPRHLWGISERVLVDRVTLNVDWEAVRTDSYVFTEDEQNKRQWGTTGTFQAFKFDPRIQGEQRFNAIGLDQITQAAAGNVGILEQVMANLLAVYTIRLDGRTRFQLISPRSTDDLQARPTSHLSVIFRNPAVRLTVRRLVYDAFGTYFVIDPTAIQQLRIRLSTCPPSRDEEEQSLTEEARRFHAAAQLIENCSDGVQAYTGIMCAMCAGSYKLTLIDEPEAFLHPPLARRLGRETARLAGENGGQLLAATHSSDFLLGCVESGWPVTVLRMSYVNRSAQPRLVDPQQLLRFLKHPLFRSANVVSGLFHDGVVVTESDNDRAFYSEIYGRLRQEELGLPDILFLNAQNKQTAREIFGPLRRFGVPAAVVFDIDIIKDRFSETLDAAQVPTPSRAPWGQWRSAVKDAFVAADIDMKQPYALNRLPSDTQTAANDLFDQLDQYGVFVVRNGELEAWLASVGITAKKTDWAVAMLERLGEPKGSTAYIPTGDDDVRRFVRDIAVWVRSPARKGT
jgi:ABC-type cobalamin/Fe3+-siderophores transport system ATPase subunit